MLIELKLGHYHDAFRREGYAFASDLVAVGAAELDAVASRMGMRPPEAKRLFHAVQNHSNWAKLGRTQTPAGPLRRTMTPVRPSSVITSTNVS